jgi:hypothetical protein
MNVPFLLFVIAILLVAIFWELCKINSRLKRTLPTMPLKTSEGLKFHVQGEANDPVAAKPLD